MKKRRFAGLILLAPLLLFTACGGGPVPLAFSSNWYKNTTLGSVENTHEELEYEITFDSEPQNGYSIAYTDGIYKTSLTNAMLTLEKGQQGGLVLTTELGISVQFDLNGTKSQTFRDTVTTEVEFLPVAERLRPVRSKRTVQCHAPVELPIPEYMFVEYSYTYEVAYDDALSKATATYTDLLNADAAPVVKEHEIGDGATFLDNEQIAFALRGLPMDTAVRFRTINTATDRVASIGFNDLPVATALPVDFEMDGVRVQDAALPAYSVSLAFTGNSPGRTQTLVYAKIGDNPTSNTYRNVLLREETPILFSLGTLQYRLVKATFTEK